MKKKPYQKLALVLLIAISVVAVFSASFPKTAQAENVILPKDESPHRDAGVEWWYYTGHLTGKDIFGKTHEYGFEAMVNRSNALGFEPLAAMYNGQLGITDLTRGSFKTDQLMLSIQPDIVPDDGGFNILIGTLQMKGKSGKNHISGGFADLSYSSIDLTLTQSTPYALHGDDGIIPYGPWGTSYYYSQPNLKVSGTLVDHGILVEVTGIAWMDHQWGDFGQYNGTAGWDWFSIQLDDKTQYMLYFIHDANFQPVQNVGTLVNADGTTTNIAPDAMVKTPVAGSTWTSSNTGLTYQMDWIINVPGGTLTVTPQLQNQEMWNSLIPQMIYWEGSCNVSGTVNGKAVTGKGYVEQTKLTTFPTSGAVWEQLKAALGL